MGLWLKNLQYAEIVVVAYHRGELLAKQVVMAARLQLVLGAGADGISGR